MKGLERLILNRMNNGTASQKKLAGFAGKQVRIWSGEWGLWWRANASGYTSDWKEAGVYSFEDAYGRTNHCGSEKRIEYHAERP